MCVRLGVRGHIRPPKALELPTYRERRVDKPLVPVDEGLDPGALGHLYGVGRDVSLGCHHVLVLPKGQVNQLPSPSHIPL